MSTSEPNPVPSPATDASNQGSISEVAASSGAQGSSACSAQVDESQAKSPRSHPPEVGPQSKEAQEHDEFDPEWSPEGTLHGWLSVLGAFFSMFVTFGYLNSFGIYQDFYQRQFLPDYPPSTIAWIGSLQYFLIFGCGVFAGRLFDAGYFYHLFTAFSILTIVCQMLLGLCTEYYQIFLCQGIGIGLGFGFLMNLTVGVPAQWFRRRRAVAMGVMASGSSLGGIIFPIAVDRLSAQVGFPWAMRIIGFILLFSLVVARLTMRTRLPQNKEAIRIHGISDLLNFRFFFHIPSFAFYTLGAFLISFGIYTPFTYITGFASDHPAINPSIGPYLLPIINAASTFGRIGPAFVADEFGRFNTIIPCLLSTAVLIIAWPACTTTASVIVFAILFGFFSGVYVSLIPACASQLASTAVVGQILGLMFFFLGIACALGPPISGALLHAGAGGNNYWAAAGFAAACVLAGSLVMLGSRHVALNGKLTGKI